MATSEVVHLIGKARRLAQVAQTQVPSAPVYGVVLECLSQVESALSGNARAAYDASTPLSIIAVRELDESNERERELSDSLFDVTSALRELAGLPYYE